ncbi:MAG: hypothetical protein K0S08_599 [Gammaproteobacteria bacterium]|jgi:intracellular multiplication protein IcmP|nr:hypothetical protein [Gammaproteobacteria bacterium]
MPPAQPQQGSDENAALWISVLTIVAIVIIWFTLHQWIAFFFLKLKLFEVDLLLPFTSQFKPLAEQLRALTPQQAGNITISELATIGNQVGNILRYPVIAILVICGIAIYFGNTASHFRASYNMKRLAAAEKSNWPQISPVVPINLVETPIDQGPWAMALNPMLFAKKHHLLITEKQFSESNELSSAVKIKVSLRRLEAKQIFLMQLGSYWHGVNGLPIHVKALFAMFAAKAHGNAKAVDALNAQIAKSAADSQFKNLNFQGVDALLAKYANEKLVQQITNRHAFVYTVMASMLQLARLDGVYASADFLWLKPIDRRLWYTLNCVGRKTPFVEVAGIFSHLNAELLFNKPIFVPMVDEAVDALEVAITEILFKPTEELNP